jgi:hypothetical protein
VAQADEAMALGRGVLIVLAGLYLIRTGITRSLLSRPAGTAACDRPAEPVATHSDLEDIVSIGAIIVIIFTALIIAALAMAGWVEYSKRKLRTSFGPEYHRVVQERGSRKAADRELQRRVRTHDALPLTPVSGVDQAFYATSWEHVQGGFLDDPVVALVGAEQLVVKLLDARGYPGEDQNERLALLSVRHANTLAGYRQAQRISEEARTDPAAASTEAMRTALMQYHALFDELLAAPGASAAPRRNQDSEVAS